MCLEVGRPDHPTPSEGMCMLIPLRTAYTIYSFFEWSLVLLDVGFDAVTAMDFSSFELVVKDVKGLSRGYVQWLPK